MTSLFSILALLAVVSFGAWFMSNSVIAPTTEVDGTNPPTKSPMLGAVDEAERLKEVIETTSERISTTPTNSALTINLSSKGLTKISADIFKRSDLEVLIASNNALTGALQAEVRHLTKLRALDLSYNQFTGVPAEIGQLSNLEELNLAHNELTGLPHELGNLKKLRVLDLRGNDYSRADLDIIRRGLSPSVDIRVDD